MPSIFPTPAAESDNRVICVSGVGSNKPFQALMTNFIPCLDMLEKTQCFPFYTYDEEGGGRRENITDWALAQFRTHYGDDAISKWDLFYSIYALLQHPQYRERYAANLKRELPRIPFVPVALREVQGRGVEALRAFAEAGRRLAELHVHYERQPAYPLDLREQVPPEAAVSLRELHRVEKMRLSPDQTQIRYNAYLTLAGVPAEAFEYRLGTRSALEWVLDQYRVKTDRRSGIVSDPNRDDDPDYILRLLKQVVTVSVETARILKQLPEM